MKHRLWVLAIGGAALVTSLGCSKSDNGDVAGGGFETSDLKALVIDTNGVPVASARVWLLAEVGDSSAAMALDSLVSDTTGLVRFPLRDTLGLGLEAGKGDSLGVVQSQVGPPFDSPIRLVLRRARALTLGCQAFGSHQLLISGSHFVQSPPAVCTDSFTIVFPPGPQNLLDIRPLGAPPWIIPVQADSLPYWMPHGPPPGQGGPPPSAGHPPSVGGP